MLVKYWYYRYLKIFLGSSELSSNIFYINHPGFFYYSIRKHITIRIISFIIVQILYQYGEICNLY